MERPGLNWLTSMWRAIQPYHYVPTLTGYSPHKNRFARDCIKQGVQWVPPGKAHDCVEFITNAQELAAKSTEALTKEHERGCRYTEKTPVANFQVGNAVWLERPSKLDDHRKATYCVPIKVQKRLGDDRYTRTTRSQKSMSTTPRRLRDTAQHKMYLWVTSSRRNDRGSDGRTIRGTSLQSLCHATPSASSTSSTSARST